MKKLSLRHYIAVFTACLSMAVVTPSLSSCSDDKSGEPDMPVNPDPSPATEIEMEKAWEAYYFLPYPAEYGNYYIELAKGEVGMSGYLSFPANAGDYLLCLDLNAGLDPDHANPVLPEGTYRAKSGSAASGDKTFSLGNTLAIYNAGKLADGQSQIKYIKFSDGTVTVKHNTGGGYTLDCVFSDAEKAEWKFTYSGEIPFEDKSGINDDEWGFTSNVDMTAKKASYAFYDDAEEKGCNNWIVRFFDVDILTSDGIHPNTVGHKLQMSLYTAPGTTGLEGTYTVSSEPKAGAFIPGERWGLSAAGSYVEKVCDDYQVRYCCINGGTITFVKNSDGTYNVDANLTTPEGKTVKMTYSGAIDDIAQQENYSSTLTSDVEMVPSACTGIDYYGDYYGTGTVNYGVYLANSTELMLFDFIAASGDATTLPTGTFTVSKDVAAGTLAPGSVEGNEIAPTAYVRFNETGENILAYAPVAAGQLTISREGSMYTFTFDLEDDVTSAPHRISGTVTCTLPAISDKTQAMNANYARKRTAKSIPSFNHLLRR